MKKSHQNSQQDFPEFRFTHLERYAKRWVQKYPNIQIERIILYRYHNKYEERVRVHSDDKWPITKYAVILEFSGCDEVSSADVESYPMEGDDECTKFMKEALHTGWHGDAHAFIDSAFFRVVYAQPTKDDVHREWKFFPKRVNDELDPDILENEPCSVLYDFDEPLIDLIQKVKPETELIYRAIKKKVGFAGREVDIEERWKTAALNQFDDTTKTFTLVERKYLEEMDYALNYNQSKRDFVGALLKIIVKNQTGRTFGGQKLYDQYKKV